MTLFKTHRIYIAGHRGMAGSALLRKLPGLTDTYRWFLAQGETMHSR
jgi:hypothetical protein